MEVPSIFLNRLLTEAAKRGASDLHLTVGSQPMVRVDNQLESLTAEEIITSELGGKIIEQLVEQEELVRLKKEKGIVFVKNLAGNFRFRINIFYQKDLPALSFHYIPGAIKTLADLKLPNVFNNFLKANSGLLIIAGPFGSGKTTTIAGLIEEINMQQSKHIITLENPIEFLFIPKKSIIEQRQVGRDVKSISDGLKYCLEQDVDLVYANEINNTADFADALPLILELAAGNCLVILEINADTSIRVLEKIINSLEKKMPLEAARYNLADNLIGIVAQKLLAKRGGGLAVAAEVLLNNSAVKSLIREGKIYQLENIMQTSRQEGMINLDRAITDLVNAGEVRGEEI